jgi:hypothetical protein
LVAPSYVLDPCPNPFLDAALRYAALGWPVLPLVPRDKLPLGELVPTGFKAATTDPATIRAWWSRRPDANLGLALPPGLAALDVDPRHGGDAELRELLEARGDPLPATPIQRTGGGGLHILFRLPPGRRLIRRGHGIEGKGSGSGYVVAWPSVHPSGGVYTWQEGAEPWDLPVADAPADFLEAPKPTKAPKAPDSALASAADRWLADRFVDHAAGNPARTCPACGHAGCFGPHRDMPLRWACFSANHGTDSGNLGSPNDDGTVWRFDEIDLEARRRGCSPREVLTADGYLDGMPVVREPERDPAVVREVLPLTDARQRALDLVAEATQRRRSIDLAGEAGLGKSHAAIVAEVDRLAAWDGKGRPPVSLIAVGGARDLAQQRAEEVRRVVADLDLEAEVAVRVGLGRQEPGAGSFRCIVAEESSARVRWGFSGCASCPHAPREPDAPSLCASTAGAYLADWRELRALTSRNGGRPAVVVLPVAALPTWWHRAGRTVPEEGLRDDPGLRVILDDADDVHGGLVTARDVDLATLRAAWPTAREGLRLARAAGRRRRSRPIEAAVADALDHDDLSTRTTPTADPALVAWLLRLALRVLDPAGRVRRERLGDLFEALVRRRPRLTNYVAAHPFAGGAAWLVAQRRGERWHGLGLGATVWNLLREHIETRGLPTVEDRGDAGRTLLAVDRHLAAAARAGCVVRLGVAPLPAFVRDAVGIEDAVEVIVPTSSCAVAPGLPRGRSHGRRGATLDAPTIADRTADAIIDDLRAAHPGRTLAIGGLRDERRAAGRYPVCVVGRDDRATNAHRGAVDALVLRRLQGPFHGAQDAASALLAGLGLPRPAEAPSGSTELGRAPSGALLPVDDAVRAAWLAQRTSALRNGTGRARAVERRDRVTLVLLDQDAGRWPWMLGGVQVEACEIDELPDRLGLPMPTLEGELEAMREAHDPDPARTAARIEAIEAAIAGGARSSPEIAAATGIPDRAVRRLLNRTGSVEVHLHREGGTASPPKGTSTEPVRFGPDPLSEPRRNLPVSAGPDRGGVLRRLADLPRGEVAGVAGLLGVEPRTVRRLRDRAGLLLANGSEALTPQTLRSIEDAVDRLAVAWHAEAAEPAPAPAPTPLPPRDLEAEVAALVASLPEVEPELASLGAWLTLAGRAPPWVWKRARALEAAAAG